MSTLRRLPGIAADGRTAFVTPGEGIINRLGDAMEGATIVAAKESIDRARQLANDHAASTAELRIALRVLAAGTESVIEVATLRGERLGMDVSDDESAD
ncbi:hypothetical protein [Streptomyces galilaeus]|uniref:hypothetical protein n=1 Tax=Streptomyces galilaeus TaxID=33899 RepID=UPI0038F6C36B